MGDWRYEEKIKDFLTEDHINTVFLVGGNDDKLFQIINKRMVNGVEVLEHKDPCLRKFFF